MFLIRSLFWLTIVVLLLPPAGDGPAPRVGLYQTALAARALVHDVAGLCERNAEACATSRDAADLFGRKLETGARIVGSAFGEPAGRPHGNLTAADMAAPWSLRRAGTPAVPTAEARTARQHGPRRRPPRPDRET